MKLGIETPITDKVIATVSAAFPLRIAAIAPNAIPAIIAKINEKIPNWKDTGNDSIMISITGLLYLIDTPKSPTIAF